MQKLIFFLLIIHLNIACSEDEMQDSQAEELRQLEALRNEIIDLTRSVQCIDAGEWTFTAMGTKACGGPAEYIAYPSTINTQDLLLKVETYTNREDEYNKRWGVISDCSLIAEPSGVKCTDGNAELVYG